MEENETGSSALKLSVDQRGALWTRGWWEPLGPACLSHPFLLADRREVTLGLSRVCAAEQEEAETAVLLGFRKDWQSFWTAACMVSSESLHRTRFQYFVDCAYGPKSNLEDCLKNSIITLILGQSIIFFCCPPPQSPTCINIITLWLRSEQLLFISMATKMVMYSNTSFSLRKSLHLALSLWQSIKLGRERLLHRLVILLVTKLSVSACRPVYREA